MGAVGRGGGALTGDADVRALYHALLEAWNTRDAEVFAALFLEDGESVGFDGSQLVGRDEIAATLDKIFADHETATFVAKVRNVRALSDDVAVLRAVAGVVPRGKSELNPDVNAIQALVAVRRDGEWKVALFQNTPARFHGRPEEVRKLIEEVAELV